MSFTSDYLHLFVQPMPRYTMRISGEKRWITVHEPITRALVERHLAGDLTIGSLGKWYPNHALIDIDRRPWRDVEAICGELDLSERNSVIASTETPDSYHILFRPEYKGKPATIRLLHQVLGGFCRRHHFELYPTGSKCARLPFGPSTKLLSEGWELLGSPECMHFFQKLDEFDLSSLPFDYIDLGTDRAAEPAPLTTYREGRELYENGLVVPNSRHDSQYKVLYYLWRRNVEMETAIGMTFEWIMTKHNGKSRTITQHRTISREIRRQAERIWGSYTRVGWYPDETHNRYNGHLTREDVPEILRICGGSLPRSRFLHDLVMYAYPRRRREQMRVHSDWLQQRTGNYKKYLGEWERQGILKRGRGYVAGHLSKSIRMQWPFRAERPVLEDERSPESLEGTLRAAFTPEDTRAMMLAAGVDRRNLASYLRTIYKKEAA